MRNQLRTHYVLAWMALLLLGGMFLVHAVSYAALYRTLSIDTHGAQLLPHIHGIFLRHLGLVALLMFIALIIFALVLYRGQRRLSQLAALDPLTDSLNQQTFDVVFELFLYRSIRDHSPLCAVLINLDHLTQINQLHGHLAGDAVLQDFSQLVRNMQRRSDALARWRDNEFILLLPDCALEEATRIADQLRLRIRNHDFGLAKNWIVTFSAGVAEYATGESEDEFLLRLEDALGRAKQHGRNRVEVAAPAFSTILPVFGSKR